MSKIRYQIIRFQIDKPGQIVKFQQKLNSYLTHCTGFLLRHTKGIQTPFDIAQLGWLTATFNNLKEHKIAASVGVPAIGISEENNDYQILDVELEKGKIIAGVYLDTVSKSLFKPYSVSLYLRCVAEPPQAAKTIEPVITKPIDLPALENKAIEVCIPNDEENEGLIPENNPDHLC
jgi:hypothetical protein